MRSEARDRSVSFNRARDATPGPAAVRKRVDAWREALTHQASGHPARTVAIALGAGYLVGGGLISRFTARIVGAGLRIGLRVAALPFVSQRIVTLGRDLIDGAALESSRRGAKMSHEVSSEIHDAMNLKPKESRSPADQKER